jgi:hypothetical protein
MPLHEAIVSGTQCLLVVGTSVRILALAGFDNSIR